MMGQVIEEIVLIRIIHIIHILIEKDKITMSMRTRIVSGWLILLIFLQDFKQLDFYFFVNNLFLIC